MPNRFNSLPQLYSVPNYNINRNGPLNHVYNDLNTGRRPLFPAGRYLPGNDRPSYRAPRFYSGKKQSWFQKIFSGFNFSLSIALNNSTSNRPRQASPTSASGIPPTQRGTFQPASAVNNSPIKIADTLSDGTLNTDGYVETAQKAIDAQDGNVGSVKDRALSLSEFTPVGVNLGATDRTQLAGLFRTLDDNKDGKIDSAELGAYYMYQDKQDDSAKNPDGVITPKGRAVAANIATSTYGPTYASAQTFIHQALEKSSLKADMKKFLAPPPKPLPPGVLGPPEPAKP